MLACLLGSGEEIEVLKSSSLTSLRTSCGVILSPSFRFHPFLRSSRGEQTGSFAKAPRFLPKLMAVTDDDEEDLWAGLEDNDSKISVSSNLLEVRRASPPICRCFPPPLPSGSYHLLAADNGCSQLARPLTAPWPAKGGGSRSQG